MFKRKYTIYLNTVFIFVFTFVFLELIAQEKQKDDEGEISDFHGAFKIYNWDKDLKLPEVIIDSRNISREPLPEKERGEDKVDGIAGKIRIKEKITWQPMWFYEGVGGVRLPSITISDDKTLLAVLEKTGETKGPNGSRIILIRTADWKIVRIFESNQKKVEKISFVPSGEELILLCSKQQEIKQPNEIIVIDLISGETQKNKRFRQKIKDIVFSRHRAVILLQQDESSPAELYELNTETLELGKKFQTINTDGILAGSIPISGKFIYAGNKSIEIFGMAEITPLKQFSPPENKIPASAILISDEKNSAVISYSASGSYLIKDDMTKLLVKNSDATITFDPENSVLLASSMKNDSITLFKVPEFTQIETLSAASSKPKTSGDLCFASSLAENSFLFISTHGYFYTVDKKSRKWKKNIIIEPFK